MLEFCKNCGCGFFVYKQVGPHQGKYCLHCGSWQKWVPKSEFIMLKQVSQNNDNIVAIDSCDEEVTQSSHNIIPMDSYDEEVPW